MNEDEQHDASEPRIPDRLAKELKALYAPPRRIPSHVDRSVLARARRYLAQSRRLTPLAQFPRWLAAAAAIVLAAWIGTLLFSSKPPVFAREDLNRDGRVDVLDAFSLARKLQEGIAGNSLLDFNNDGVVDQKDVDTLAARAVKLEKEQG